MLRPLFFCKRNEIQKTIQKLEEEKNKIQIKLADFQGDVSSQDQAYEDLKKLKFLHEREGLFIKFRT